MKAHVFPAPTRAYHNIAHAVIYATSHHISTAPMKSEPHQLNHHAMLVAAD
jgi:hypothetical protein